VLTSGTDVSVQALVSLAPRDNGYGTSSSTFGLGLGCCRTIDPFVFPIIIFLVIRIGIFLIIIVVLSTYRDHHPITVFVALAIIPLFMAFKDPNHG